MPVFQCSKNFLNYPTIHCEKLSLIHTLLLPQEGNEYKVPMVTPHRAVRGLLWRESEYLLNSIGIH